MKFEVINDKNTVINVTHHAECIQPKRILTAMSKAGYKFRLNGKIISLKKLCEQVEDIANGENN